MSKIDILETDNKIIAVCNREEMMKDLSSSIAHKVVDYYLHRFTVNQVSADLERKIEREVSEKIVDKFVNENYQQIVSKVSFDVIANLVTLSTTKRIKETI